MSDSVACDKLEVIGFLGAFSLRDWPLRLLPIYRDRERQFGLVPPFEIKEDASICGVKVSVDELDYMHGEGEFTLLDEPRPALSDHTLWLNDESVRYEPRLRAEQGLDAICLSATQRAQDSGLAQDVACDELFRAIRARPTAIVYALLAAHFELRDDTAQMKSTRKELTTFRETNPDTIENEIIHGTLTRLPLSLRKKVAHALELAGRTTQASQLICNTGPELPATVSPRAKQILLAVRHGQKPLAKTMLNVGHFAPTKHLKAA